MKNFFRWLWSYVIMALLIALIGAHAYYKYFQAPELSYMIKNYVVFSGVNTNKDLVTLFVNDEPVEQLYMTTIKIENTGGDVLERSDFSAEINPLRITGDDIKSIFIDTSNSKFSSDTQIAEKDGEFLVNFNWLNPGDIITINVLRDNINSKIDLKGSFAKIGAVKEILFKDFVRQQALIRILVALFLAVCIVLLVFIIYYKIHYGAFWLSFKQFAVCAYVSVYYKKNKKKRKQVLKEVISTKDDKKLQKILDKYCGGNV